MEYVRMLDNEPTGGSGAGEEPTRETAEAKTERSTRKAPAPPSVVFMAPDTPPARAGEELGAKESGARQSGARQSGGRQSAGKQSAGQQSAGTEPAAKEPAAKTAPSRRRTKAAQDDAEPEADAKPARRTRSRRGKTAEAADAAEPEAATSQDEAEAKPARRRTRSKAKADDDAAAAADDAAPEAAEDDSDEDSAGRRRRRRGRRGRGRGKGGEEGGDEAEDTAAEAESESGDSEGPVEETSTVRRRRRRRRKGAADSETSDDDGVTTVVRVREPRASRDEVQGVAGSTRLEAKRQRRRDGREQRRTRPPILTESEFLARREAVDRVMVIRSTGDRTQIGVLEDDVLVEHHVSQQSSNAMAGNVYLGKVQNVLPSMEAAFVDIGRGRNAVLYAGEVNWDVAGLEGRTRTIEQALKPGDSVLVQVTKDPVGHKGARLTSHVSLSGRHLVYVPHGHASGISRKLPDTERKRLRDTLKKLVPEHAGVIVRTAAEGASEDDLERDVTRLQAQWESIEQKAKGAKPPTLLYEEPDLVIRVVRDIFNEDFKELVIQGEDAWEMVEPYLEHVSPELVSRVRRHTGTTDLFADTRVDEQLLKALDRKVYLPSGGHLVIDRTEAMTVIDVNTGKFTGKGGNLEETVTRNNLEAAEEIVHQLRLRDIGGILVIDFIDMVLESNRDLVLRRLTECLGRDRTKHQVTEITSLGLVQMTRKRVGQGLLDVFSETCEHCRGRGVIVNTAALEAKPPKSAGAAQVRRVAAASANGASADTVAHDAEAASGSGDGAAEAAGESAADSNGRAEKTRSSRRRRRKPAAEAAEAADAAGDGSSGDGSRARATSVGGGPDGGEAGGGESGGPASGGASKEGAETGGAGADAAVESGSDERAPV
jgi:ribonuclease E